MKFGKLSEKIMSGLLDKLLKEFKKNIISVMTLFLKLVFKKSSTGPRSAVGKVSGYRCESDCRSRGREFDPGPVPYFRGF